MLTKSQIEKLNLLIDESHGSRQQLASRFDELIYMLHYLESDTFTTREVQGAADILKELGDVLRS